MRMDALATQSTCKQSDAMNGHDNGDVNSIGYGQFEPEIGEHCAQKNRIPAKAKGLDSVCVCVLWEEERKRDFLDIVLFNLVRVMLRQHFQS